MSKLINNQYEMQKLVGHGKKGEVFKGYDHSNQKTVAIKKTKSISRAKSEALVMEAYGSHQYLPEIYDFMVEKGYAYIVMEWIDGEPLNKSSIKYDEKNAVENTIKILEGLDHLHKNGFLHCDLKRGNIMLIESKPNVKIIDFGRSKLMRNNEKHKVNGKKDNRAFKPAEKGYGITDELNKVAVLCGYMLTGKKTKNPKKINITNQKLQKILIQAMGGDKNKRYKTAEEMITALKPFA
ncbi:protein kinase domain-containing protein [Alkalibacillus haloalkaliphilus]|uniref:protein kinase domain-containing protein n=1 Tax=Alkalibacillus haloalkaliphilus TaxID=94136 RepID=UPI0029362DA3|nr:protein kinase [Alkalibacillus haloalkaliphilus]MDV2583337.1 protein kinase [Alkalibacillus haloalkaliphilus]